MTKLELRPYRAVFKSIFKREKKKLIGAIGKCEINHIGSTAVPGLGGKGIIDIMIALHDWKREKEITGKLKDLGFTHVHPRESGRR